MNQLSRLFQLSPFHTGAGAGGVNIKIFKRLADGLEADGMLFTKSLILPSLVDDYFLQRFYPENVHTRFDLQMDRRVFNEVRLARISQDQVEAASFGAFFYIHPDDGMGKCRMSTHHKNRFGGIVIFKKRTDGAVSQLSSQSHFRGAVAEPGTVVDMVVTDDCALKFLRKIDFLVQDFPTAQHPDAVRAVFRNDFFQTPGSGCDGLFPRDQFQLVHFTYKGLGETLFVIQQLMNRDPFDTEVFTV